MSTKKIIETLNLRKADNINESRLANKATRLLRDIVEKSGHSMPLSTGDRFETNDWKVEVKESVIMVEFKSYEARLEIRRDSDEVKVFDYNEDRFIDTDDFLDSVLNNLPESAKIDESSAGDMVDVEKVIAALANKRGNEYVEQIEDIEVITKQGDGVVLKITKMSDDGTKELGDFLTNAELDNVKVNNESVSEKISKDQKRELEDVIKNNSFMNLRDSLMDLGYEVDYVNSPVPLYTIKKDGQTIHIVNKKYVEDPDFTVGDIAIGESNDNLSEYIRVLGFLKLAENSDDWEIVRNKENIIRAISEKDEVEIEADTNNDRITLVDGVNNLNDFLEVAIKELEESSGKKINENRVGRMRDFLNYMDYKPLLEEVVGALDHDMAKSTFLYILKMEGTDDALEISEEIEGSNSRQMDRYDMLYRLLDEGFIVERLLESVIKALSEREANDVFDYIARMHDIPENNEVDEEDKEEIGEENEDKSRAERIIEKIKNKHKENEEEIDEENEVNEANIEVKNSRNGVTATIELDVEDFVNPLEAEGFAPSDSNIRKIAESVLDGVFRDYDNNKSRIIYEAIDGLSGQLEE